MAYAAVVSLAQTLDQLLHFDSYHFHYPKPQIDSLYHKVCFLQSCLEEIFPAPRSSRSEANDLEIQIRDVIYKAQDAIELFISSQIRASETPGGDQNSISILLEEIIAELDPITETAENAGGWIRESNEDALRSDLMFDNPHISSSRNAYLLGREDDRRCVVEMLTGESSRLQAIAISGLAGVGKTALVRNIFQELLIIECFVIRCWVTVSAEYHVREVLLNLLGSMNGSAENRGRSESELGESIYRYLKGRRYLIVMDDIWDTRILDEVRNIFPDDGNGSRIVITTRNAAVADYPYHKVDLVLNSLDQDASWMLFCKTVFGDEDCPPELENVGRNIAKKCVGIPLSIVVVGGLLSKSTRTVDYWKSIEEDVHGAAAMGEESYLEILSLSYNNLPSRLKACFLYIGAFPQDSEILISKLIKLWVAEGFLAPSPSVSLEENANQHLKVLIDRNLVSIGKIGFHGQAKTCSMQGSFRQFAIGECRKEKFFHTINRYTQQLLEGTDSQRRICVHKNSLMCTKDVYLCTRSIELARTLLYAGPNHHHPLPFCLTFDLLRVLDAFSVYFIELPNALFELIHLRYLAFTYDEDLPPSISKLWNLLILIVRQHPKIIIRRPLILPVEIWNMSQIRHLLLSETVLPDLCVSQNSILLENLQSLSNINAACCTKEMLQNMPNLKKLGMWIEFPSPLHFYLDQLPHLEALKFTVLKPIIEEKIDFIPKLVFPKTLKKLSLSGCGLPWEDMTIIGQLPCLEALKLRELAFQGPEWSPIEGEFCRLRFLLLESLELVVWNAESSHFPCLERLIIRHCYELEEISSGIAEISSLQLIKLAHCSPSAVLSACKIQEERESLGDELIQLDIHSSRECRERIKEELKNLDYKDCNGINFSWE